MGHMTDDTPFRYSFYPALYHHPRCARYTANVALGAPTTPDTLDVVARTAAGDEFEQNVLTRLRADFAGVVVDVCTPEQISELIANAAQTNTISPMWLHLHTPDDVVAAEMSLLALRSPATVLTGSFFDVSFTSCRPDILIRDAATSTWYVGDIKHASAHTSAKQRIGLTHVTPLSVISDGVVNPCPAPSEWNAPTAPAQPHHSLQLEHYRRALIEALSDTQHHVSPLGFIIDRDSQVIWRDLDGVHARYNTMVSAYRDALTAIENGVLPPPDRCSKCSTCTYMDHCVALRHDTDNLTLLNGLPMATAVSLRTVGVETVADLDAVDTNTLLSHAAAGRIYGYKKNPAKAVQLQLTAHARKQNRILPRVPHPPSPASPVEVHLDIENLPVGIVLPDGSRTRDGYTYLVGVTVIDRAAATESWHPFLADGTPASEVSMINELAEFIQHTHAAHPQARGYVYAAPSAERKIFKDLAAVHPQSRAGELVDWVQSPLLVDVLAHIKSFWAFPTSSLSLKNTASFVGFSWEDSEPSGANSVVWATAMLSSPDPEVCEANRARVIQYNRDDTLATFALTSALDMLAAAQI